jgi:pyridoxal phosphate enzyme (YggS family)
MDTPREGKLASRFQLIEDRIQAACRRAGRSRDEVTLVAVTKTVDSAIARLLPKLGLFELGESRPQELWRKAAELPQSVHWHLVGHLQRNKIERTLPLVHLIHSVDSVRLLQALDQEADKQERALRVLVEVNASREREKHGFAPEELPGVVQQIHSLHQVQVIGLMTMAALEPDPERWRPTFALLRSLAEQLKARISPPHRMEHLSMGMTNDFQVAIEEGATLIRLGTALFEGIGE